MLYFDTEGNVICTKCANGDPKDVKSGDVNWEDNSLYCDGCGQKLEAAYSLED